MSQVLDKIDVTGKGENRGHWIRRNQIQYSTRMALIKSDVEPVISKY